MLITSCFCGFFVCFFYIYHKAIVKFSDRILKTYFSMFIQLVISQIKLFFFGASTLKPCALVTVLGHPFVSLLGWISYSFGLRQGSVVRNPADALEKGCIWGKVWETLQVWKYFHDAIIFVWWLAGTKFFEYFSFFQNSPLFSGFQYFCWEVLQHSESWWFDVTCFFFHWYVLGYPLYSRYAEILQYCALVQLAWVCIPGPYAQKIHILQL